jgi:hypothetical protein
MTTLANETIPGCKICGKIWKRKETDNYYYHDSVGVVCRNHKGVEEWYNELFKNMVQELED